MKSYNPLLEEINQVISRGPYSDNWDSLGNYTIPNWYLNAKFGIFIHWGVYGSAFGNEWHPRNMYIQGSNEFNHHIKTYGEHKKFDIKILFPCLPQRNFRHLSGLNYLKVRCSLCCSCSGTSRWFQMYRSDLSEFNAYKMGLKGTYWVS